MQAQTVSTTVPLTGVTVVQTSGVQLQIGQQPGSGSGAGASAGTVVTATAPAIKDHSAPASVTLTGKDKQGQTVSYIWPVLVIRTPDLRPADTAPPIVVSTAVPKLNDPLLLLGTDFGQVSEGATHVGLYYHPQGGTGRYTFTWEYLKAGPSDPDIPFTISPNGRTLLLDAPLVDRMTDLKFRLTVSDGGQTARREFTLRVLDLPPRRLVAGAAAPLTVAPGHAITLSMPTVTGGVPFPSGRPPYDYSIVQTAGPQDLVLPLATAGNWGTQAPSLTAGAADVVLAYEMSATDRNGSVITVTQQVTVQAPAVLVASLDGIPKIGGFYGNTVALQAKVTGGRPPYRYAWRVVQQVVFRNETPPPVILESTEANPTFQNTYDRATTERFREIVDNTQDVTLTLSDADGVTVVERTQIKVLNQLAIANAPQYLLCGDIDAQQPCSDLDIILGMANKCPDTQPFGLNTYIINAATRQARGGSSAGGAAYEFRRCVAAADAYNLWVLQTSQKAECRALDPDSEADITCHFACFGDSCNLDTVPPNDTLVGPPVNGELTVGVRPLRSARVP